MRKIHLSFLTAIAILFSAFHPASAQCVQNFDAVVAPALPNGWTAVTATDCVNSNPWATVNTTSDNPPNSAFVSDPSCISDEYLVSETYQITSPAAQLTFRNNFNLESGFDGMVLEISINGAAFQDIIAAGGSFVTGGYNGIISVNFMSPILGRNAWTGNSGGFITSTITLPAAANGQPVVLRFRRATDSSLSGVGVFIDNIAITGCTSSALPCAQNFDGVTAPALPAGWAAITPIVNPSSTAWVTSTTTPNSAPNAAFTNDPGTVSDEWLHSNTIPITSAAAQLTFRNNFNLESGFDGMVLEISINGGPFNDIIAAGGSFVTGGYNGVISVNFMSPILGRNAWTGNSGGYITTTVNLPAAANGQSIVLRWRRATDSSLTGVGARIDDIMISGSNCGACVAPLINGQPVNTLSCAGSNTSFTVNASGTNLTYQWQVNSGSGFNNISNAAPYSGATAQTLTITAAPASLNGNLYRVIITGSCGTVTSSSVTLSLSQVTHSNVLSTPSTVCSPGATVITGTASGSAGGNVVLGTSGTINLAIPDNNPGGASSMITLPANAIPTAADLKVRLNMRHSWVGDLRVTLTSPCGTSLLFDRPGVPATTNGNNDNLGTSNAATPPPAVYIFDIAGATIIPETNSAPGFIPAGTYKPSDGSNPGFAHNWAGITFPCGAGNWTLTITDNVGGDVGMLVDWAILKTNTFTHTLTGAGTIVQNPASGPNNANASFNVTNIPAGVQTYVLTSTDAAGCTAVSNVFVTVNPTPVVTISPAAPVICSGQIQTLSASVTPPTQQLVTGGGSITIPIVGTGAPYPSTLVVTGLPATGVSIKSVSLNGISHTFPSDVDIVLQSPTGVNVILMSDVGGGTDINNINLTFDDAAATTLPGVIVGGTYRPTNTAGPDNFPAPGPGSITQVNPTLASFGTGNYNGSWKLFVIDQFNLDGGLIDNWTITFNIPVPVTWSSATGTIYSDPAATVLYTGTPTLDPVYVRPTATTTATTTTYTATATRVGCTGSANVTVTSNALPAITTQPAPATQTVCPGFNVTYSVVATGTGLTYQWRKNGVNLVNGLQASGSLVSGATTSSVTLLGVVAADAGTYTVVVSGTCTPAVTSANAVLVISSAPTISTQPANQTACVGSNASFSVTAAGTPTPTIFQWQVSTDGGVNWTDLPAGFTSSLTVSNVTLAQNGNRYRVRVTNSCGQTITSNGNATLTVNALPVVSATALPARICLSGTSITLTGSPAGGTWTGVGVNNGIFTPANTSPGRYTLTYSFTNAQNCTGTASVVANVVEDQECNRIRRLSDEGTLTLYPNPNNGKFFVRVNSTIYSYLGMKVYNSNGMLVNGEQVNGVMTSPTFNNLGYGSVIPIDLSHLPSGPYMVKFYYDDGVRTSETTFKVIVQR